MSGNGANPQGLRITVCLNYCPELAFVKGWPLRFSLDRPLFKEKKHGHVCFCRLQVLHQAA